MLKIKDKSGKTKYILFDDKEEPISIDDLILQDKKKQQEVEEECENQKK